MDPGFRNTGWAYRAPSGFVYSGTITSNNEWPTIKALGHILGELEGRIAVCDTLVVEDYLAPVANRGVVYLIGALIGLARLGQTRRIEVVPNVTWVKQYTGKTQGRHEEVKSATAEKVRKHFQYEPKSQHEADALGMLHWWETGGYTYHRDKYSHDEERDKKETEDGN